MSKRLHPVDASLLPFQVGERVAFREDHETYPGMYGAITAIGVDASGALAFDVNVFDPFVGAPTEDAPVHRARMGDIQ